MAELSAGHRPQWCRLDRDATIAGALVTLAILGGCTRSGHAPAGAEPTPAARISTTPSAVPRSAGIMISAASVDRRQRSGQAAAVLLAGLTVQGRAAKTGYDREQFGSAWTDDNDAPLGHNGCDTRNDTLRRDLASVVPKPGSNGCAVASGRLNDPYTGTVIAFRRGVSSSAAVQIDHVVALSDAWQTGAQYYDGRTRIELANDPLDLLAVDGPTNEAKGDGDAATWLPPNKAYRCAYVARQVAVKARYRLWMTPAEHDASERVLRTCPGQPAPAEPAGPRLVRAPRTPTPTGAHPTAAPSPSPSPSDNAPVHYQNCDAVRAAGAAPLHRGDPGYDRHLDRDGDGAACE